MDEQFVNAVAGVTEKVFKTMVFMSPEKMVPQEAILPRTLYDVTSIVGLAGHLIGTVSVQFQTPLALKVTSNMLQCEVKELCDDVRDAIGEIGNMIAGGLKTELAGKGLEFDISIPTVVMGPGHSIGHMPGAESLFFPFKVDGESFIVAVSLKK